MPPRKQDSKKKDEGLSPRQQLAQGLKRLREDSGMSLRDLAAKTGWDHTHLHAMEQGRSLGSLGIIEDLDTVYGTTPMVKLMWELARNDKAAFREKYQRYMELESKATALQLYAPSAIPGLLQTEAYAREVIGASGLRGAELDGQVAARLERQTILTGEDPADFRAIIDEAALRRALRDPQEWRGQLAHLIEMAELPNVVIQVLPFAVGLHGLPNTHTMLLWLPDGRSVAYTETSYSGDLAEDPKDIDPLRLAYDRLRDLALSPRESVAFIEQLMEDGKACEPPENPAS